MPKLQKMIIDEDIEAYNFPQGVMGMLMRDIAAHRPGHISRIGLKTFVDPRDQRRQIKCCNPGKFKRTYTH